MEQQRTTSRVGHRVNPLFCGGLLAVLLLCAGPGVSAQTFDAIYNPSSNEDGQRRARPVLSLCAGYATNPIFQHGYIAVGSSAPTTQNHSDVWVVRTSNFGVPVWEYRYDIANGSDDFGASIYELTDNTGWIVTASTVSINGDLDIAVFKIDCGGAVLWSTVLPNPGWDDEASDVIVMTTGTTGAMPPTNPGDIVVVGTTTNINPPNVPVSSDAYIARLNAIGGLIWDNRYDISPSPFTPTSERLFAVTEADLFGTQVAADILAVGSAIDNGGPSDGYILRVSGINGTIGAGTYQGNTTYGGCINVPDPFCGPPTGTVPVCADEAFHSVIQLANPNETDGFGNRDVVIVGTTNSPGSNENLAVKLDGGNPAVVDVARHFGTDNINGCTSTTFYDAAWDVDEVDFEMEGDVVSQWDLAVVGETTATNWAGASNEVTITFLSPTTLTPDPLNAYQYDGTSGLTRTARSIHVVSTAGFRTEGFILGGTESAAALGSALLLIKTNQIGATDNECHGGYELLQFPIQWTPVQQTPTLTPLGNRASATVARTSENAGGPDCLDGEESVQKLHLLATQEKLDITVSPNVIGNMTRTVDVSIAGVGIEGYHTVEIYTASGRRVCQEDVSIADGEFTLAVPPLDTGYYIVTLQAGSKSLSGWISAY